MNPVRTVTAGLVGGIALWLASFVLHGVILANTYMKYPDVFSQKAANPLHFLAVEILIAIPAAFLFAKTRGSWSGGIGGGLAFGFWIGAFGFFAQFFNPLVIEGFPYYLSWCWGGTNLLTSLVLGVVLGAMIRKA
jgi:hypothetical protein